MHTITRFLKESLSIFQSVILCYKGEDSYESYLSLISDHFYVIYT